MYGKHALVEALGSVPQAIQRVYLAPQSQSDPQLVALLREHGIRADELSTAAVQQLERGAAHQGVVAHIAIEKLLQPYKDFIATTTLTPASVFVVLDELQDPHNVGAIIRSAAAFGATAVLVPEHNQAPITGAVIKVSAGMAFRVPLVSIGNVNQTLRDLKERGAWVYGLDAAGEQSLHTEPFEHASVIVVGNEAEGMRQKTRELCDILLSIPMHARCESLNAAVSTAVTLAAWSARHPEALS
jgi:23S rRNA (guanosine2251-2'-O)-methyltransferase